MSSLLLIFISMLLAWNAVDQPKWCSEFWEWLSTFRSKKEEEKE